MADLVFEERQVYIRGVVNFDHATSVCHDLCSGLDKMSSGHVVINLAGLECEDSSILSCLVLSLNYAKVNGIHLSFVSCPDKLNQLIGLCGLNYLLNNNDDLEEKQSEC